MVLREKKTFWNSKIYRFLNLFEYKIQNKNVVFHLKDTFCATYSLCQEFGLNLVK